MVRVASVAALSKLPHGPLPPDSEWSPCVLSRPGPRFYAALFAQLLALTLAPWLLGGCTIPGPLAKEGLPNFARVDEHLLRGAQPASAGYAELARMAVGRVVDVRRGWE